MSTTIGGKMVRGAAWMILLNVAQRSLGLLSMLVLVRVLAPEDFGVVAMAMAFIAVGELATAFGFDLALIQNQQASENHYHTAWTCNLLLGGAVTLVLLLAAAPIAHFYNRPEVFWVVCALAAGSLIAGAENIGVVAFRKDLDFKKEFRFVLAKRIIGAVITIPLAIWLRSYWALVAGMLFSRCAGTAVSYLVHPFRPRLSFERIGELMSFSRWIVITNIIVMLKERASDFVIGNMLGPRALGLYSIANEFASLPQTELSAPVNRALIPNFAKIQGDPAALQDSFLAAIRVLALIVVPGAALVHCLAPYFVPLILGAKWLEAIPLLQMLAPAGGIIAIHSPVCALLISHGHSSRVTLSHLCYVGVLFGSMLVLLPRLGVTGAALSVLIAAVVSTPAYLYHVSRRLGIPARAVLRALLRPVIGAALAVGATHALQAAAQPAVGLLGNLLYLIAAGAGSMIIYAAVVFVGWQLAGRPRGAEVVVVDWLGRLLRVRRT